MQRVRTDGRRGRESELESDEKRCSLCVYGYNVSTNGTRSSLSSPLLRPSTRAGPFPRERLRALYHTRSMNSRRAGGGGGVAPSAFVCSATYRVLQRASVRRTPRAA